MPDLQPLYISEKETADLLGRSVKWLRDNADGLAAAGLPPIDPILKKRHRGHVEDWALERSRRLQGTPERITQTHRENLNAF